MIDDTSNFLTLSSHYNVIYIDFLIYIPNPRLQRGLLNKSICNAAIDGKKR